MRPLAARAALLAASALLATATAPAAAAVQTPAKRTGTTARGVPIVLQGRSVRIVVPKSTRRGRRIEVHCGRLTSAEFAPTGIGLAPSSMARGSRVFRTRRTMTVRLDRDVSAIAEWCEFSTQRNGPFGAATLLPRLAPRPAPLSSGPGVREGVAMEGGARFLLDGATLTLRTEKPLPGDILLFLACYDTGGGVGLQPQGVRTIAIGNGRRAVTVDLGGEIESRADSCFAESSRQGDLFLAEMGPSPAAAGR